MVYDDILLNRSYKHKKSTSLFEDCLIEFGIAVVSSFIELSVSDLYSVL